MKFNDNFSPLKLNTDGILRVNEWKQKIQQRGKHGENY